VSLTEAGREIQHSIGRAHAKDVSAAMAALSQEELELLTSLSTKLVRSKS